LYLANLETTSFAARAASADPEVIAYAGSAATARSFVRNIADLVWIETLRVAQCFFVDIANKTAFARIRSLRPSLILLTPAELRL
jgi:hypothetical protein